MERMNEGTLRGECADRLERAAGQVGDLSAFVGLDGFVDEIVHVVDKRDNAESFQRIPTIARFAERIAAAAGKSTNVEMVPVKTKLGGNGPIMANALAHLGVKVTYLGALGYPHVHPVFKRFSELAEVHSIAEPGFTDALEFEDGKLLLTRTEQLKELNWSCVAARFGIDRLTARLAGSGLVAFVNWTMLPYMSEIWQRVQTDCWSALGEPRRLMFIDLADPEKRTMNDLSAALDLVVRFQSRFDVCLGLNEKEAWELGKVLGFMAKPHTREGLAVLARELHDRLPVSSVVIHPVRYALACSTRQVTSVDGPFVSHPLITTGAGDHFNAGFCLGRMLGFDDALSLLTGVACSGFYVRTARSPSTLDLARLLRDWPAA